MICMHTSLQRGRKSSLHRFRELCRRRRRRLESRAQRAGVQSPNQTSLGPRGVDRKSVRTANTNFSWHPRQSECASLNNNYRPAESAGQWRAARRRRPRWRQRVSSEMVGSAMQITGGAPASQSSRVSESRRKRRIKRPSNLDFLSARRGSIISYSHHPSSHIRPQHTHLSSRRPFLSSALMHARERRRRRRAKPRKTS